MNVFFFSSGPTLKEGNARILSSTENENDYVIVVGLGKDEIKPEESERENRDLNREKIRTAVSAGVRALQSLFIQFLKCLNNNFNTICIIVRVKLKT